MQHPDPAPRIRHRPVSFPEPSDDDALSFRATIQFIRQSWRLCLVWLALGLFAAVAFLIATPSYYTADTTIFFYDKESRAGAAAPNSGDSIGSTYVDTQVELLRSEEVIGRVVDQKHLVADTEFGLGEPTASPAERYATISRVADSLTVRRIGISNAVIVACTSKDRAHAAMIANAVVRAYTETRRDILVRDRADAAAELNKQLADVRKKVLASEPAQTVAPPDHAVPSSTTLRPDPQDTPQAYQARYNNLLREANLLSSSEYSSVGMRVMTPAELPLRASWPKRQLVAAIAILLSVAIGFVHAVLREMNNRRVCSIAEAQRVTGLDCIVAIPKVENPARLSSPSQRQAPQPTDSVAMEEFGKAIVRLLLRLREVPKHPLVVGVVSPTTGAGASVIAAHLASALADSGDQTLLVDANWRKPTPSQPPPGTGRTWRQAPELATIWLERAESEKFDRLALRETEPISPLNASLSIAAALGQLPPEYGRVVVAFYSTEKTPDLEAAIAAIDSVVIVVDAERTIADSLDTLFRALPASKISAIVINKLAPAANGFKAELMGLVEPVARTVAAVCAVLAIWLRRLTEWRRTSQGPPPQRTSYGDIGTVKKAAGD